MSWRKTVVPLIAVGVVATLFAMGASAASSTKVDVRYPVKFGISPPMTSVQPVPPAQGQVNRERPNKLHLFPATPVVPDAVVQRHFGLTNMPAPMTSFDGIPNTVNQSLFGFELTPPDTEGAVGGNSPASNVYVQWVNLAWAVYDKTTGAMLAGPFAGNSFWAGFGGPCQTTNNGDPVILYDKLADRWLATQFSVENPYYQCFAVSTSPDPTGTYYQYSFNTGSVFGDYPKYSIWTDAYLGTYNQFYGGDSVSLLVLERAKMLVGDPTAAMIHINENGANWWSVLPADFDGTLPPPAGNAIFGQVAKAGTATGQTQDSFLIWNLTYDWTNPAAACFGASCTGQPNSIVPVATYTNLCPGTRSCIPEPAGGESVDAISGYTMYRLQWRNTGDTEHLVANHTVNDGTGVAGVRWYEMQGSVLAGWSLYQQGTLAPGDGLHRWMGSIAMDHSSNIAVGYSGSNSSTFPSVYYSGRLAGDPIGTLPQAEQQLVAGNGVINTGYSRWGDYSAMQVDPTDDCTFWYTQEYTGGGGWNWYTRIGSFKFPSCSIGPTGTLTGAVTNANNGNPVAGALVTAGAASTLTNGSGIYTFTLPVGTYDMSASKFGFAPGTASGVAVVQDTTTTQNFALQPVGSADVDGYVTDFGHGWPLYAKIVITATGAPTTTVYTDPFNGYYDVTLVNGFDYTFTVTAEVAGYEPETRPVSVTGADQTQNFALVAKTPTCTAPGYGKPAPAGRPAVQQPVHGLVTPPGQQSLTSLRGIQLGVQPRPAAAPLAAGDVITSWSAGSVGIWGADFDKGDGTVWIGNLGVLGGDNQDHEFGTDGTPTGRTISENWAGVFAADMTYDSTNGTLWQLDVGGDNCAHELSLTTLTPTGNTICAPFGTSERGLAYDPNTDTFFAGGWNDYMIYRFNRSGTIIDSVYAGIPTSGLAFNSTTNHLFAIENSPSDKITVFDTTNNYAVLGTFTVAGFGNYAGAGLEFDCQGALWAANQNDGKAYQIDSGEPAPGDCAPPGPCTVLNGGIVAGFVTDGNTNTGLVGATVANDLGGSTKTVNDANLGAGYYSFFTPTPPFNGPSLRTFTASMAKYGNGVVQEVLTPNTVNRIDFALQAGWLELSPASLWSRLYPGQTEDQFLTLTNMGGVTANYKMSTQEIKTTWPHMNPFKLVKHPKVASTGLARTAGQPAPAPRNVPLLAGAPAFGVNLNSATFYTWPDITAPGTWTQIASEPGSSYFGGAFLSGDFSKEYVVDYNANTLSTLDTTTGAVTLIGPSVPGGGEAWTGLTATPSGTMYGAATTCSNSTLYTVDPTTGALTTVGTITNAPCIIDISANSAGDLYGVEIVNDVLVKIDPATGAGTVVGPLGVSANYAQGMSFDQTTDTLYWAAYDQNGGELRVIDTATGASTLVGAFPGGAEVDALAIATFAGGGSLPWLTLTPTEGGVDPAASSQVDAQFIADGADHFGLFRATIKTSTDTPYSVNDVSVCFSKAFLDVPAGYWADAQINAIAGARISTGCGAGNFCPDDVMTRGTMALWLLLARHGNLYAPPPCVGIFADVPCETTPNADYIEEFYNEGITAGCGTDPLRYCPNDPVTRAQMSVFIMKASQAPGYLPPDCTGLFADVACPGGFAVKWIEDLYNHQITAGCGTNPLIFCPDSTTTRAQEAVFVTKAWSIPKCPAPSQPVK